jgi:protocatechuate 3,4-dioxygenase beta subunit
MQTACRCAFLAVMLLICNNVCAQTDSKEPSAVIAGKVIVENSPLQGVTVMVTAGSPQGSPPGGVAGRATTDDQGNYRITGLAAGDYTIYPFAPAFYYPSSQFYGMGGKSLNLQAGETAEGIDFKLTRGGVITGRIADSTGKPLVEERLQIQQIDENRQKLAMPFNPYGYTSDDRGIYRIYGLQPGKYLVSVGRDTRSGAVLFGGSNRYYPLTFYANASEEAGAEAVEIAPGGEAANVDIVVGKANTSYSVRGRVVSSDTGQPVSDVIVGYGATRPDGGVNGMGFSSNSQTDSRGEFRIDGVVPGQYAAFSVPLNEGDFYSDSTPFQIVEADIEGIQVTVHQGGSIAGVATIEGAADPAATAAISQLNLVARNLQNIPAGMYFQPKRVAPDGSFRLTGLSPGKTTIFLANPNQSNGLSIARIELDGTDQSAGIDVAAGQQITGVHIILSYGTGSIRGQVKIQGGTMPETATLLMVSARNLKAMSSGSSKSARVDARGQFLIQGLADGEYDVTLNVMGNVPGKRPQPSRQKVTVTQGAIAEVQFVLDLGGQN